MKAMIRVGKLYLLPSANIVRVVVVNRGQEKVFVHNYHSSSNEVFEKTIAESIFTPLLKISEVAKMVERTPQTLRRLEKQGKISYPKRYAVGTGSVREIRLYTPDDVRDLLQYFSERPRGGVSNNPAKLGDFDKQKALRLLDAKYIKEK